VSLILAVVVTPGFLGRAVFVV